MLLSKKVFGMYFGFRTNFRCVLIALAFLLVVASIGTAAGAPKTIADIALYQGSDRENILIEGAKKEGKLTLYTSHSIALKLSKEFENKYPFIEVLGKRSSSKKLLKRITEEYSARRFTVDAIHCTHPVIAILQRQGNLQEYYSPETRYYSDNVKVKGKTGVYYSGNRETYIGLGFNTESVPPEEAPKSLKDLLDPRWKGKMSIAGTSTGTRWIGAALDAIGPDFLEKLSGQDIRVHNMSAAALTDLVAAAEVPLSPTIPLDHIILRKKKGAPVEWRPLEPVPTNVGYSGLSSRAAHPHAALLFLDFFLSKEGQKIVMKNGLSSSREDIGSLRKFKKIYLTARYPLLEEYKNKANEWEQLMKQYFIMKK